MDLLKNAADFYSDLMKYEFTFILGDRKRKLNKITLAAKSEHFPHVIGLDKLKDIGGLIYKNHSKEQILFGIQNGEITTEHLEKSSHYVQKRFEFSIKNRIQLFPALRPVFDKGWNKDEITFTFIKEKAYSKIDAEYLIRFRINRDMHNYYLNLFLKKDRYSNNFIPVSFFPRLDHSYEKGQPRLTLLYKARSTEDQKEELYIHKGFDFSE